MNEEGLNLMEEIEELEKRKSSLNRDVAQAKTTIMDAANIMGKMKAKDDKIDALTQELIKLKNQTGASSDDAANMSTPPQSPSLSSAKESGRPANLKSPDTPRSFGRNIPNPKNTKMENAPPASSMQRKKSSSSSTKVLPKGDSRSKFAKSLFGNVKDKKTSK